MAGLWGFICRSLLAFRLSAPQDTPELQPPILITTYRIQMDPCKFFASGYCMRGESCRYSHETTPTSPVPLVRREAENSYASKRVTLRTSKDGPWRGQHLSASTKSYAKNSLSPKLLRTTQPVLQNSPAFRTRESNLAYPREDSRSQIPCYHYARGNCRNGSACPYSHIEGSEQKVEAALEPEVCPNRLHL